jgi:hypothetical protein
MKTLLLIALFSCGLWGARAQNMIKMETLQKDSLAISQVLENGYIKAIYEGDVNTLKSTFVAGALLFGDVKGQPYAKTLDQYLDVVQHRQSPKDSGKPFKGDILNIKIVNTIAIAEVKMKMYEFYYHDFLSLHKINGQWVIVNKMFSDTNQ